MGKVLKAIQRKRRAQTKLASLLENPEHCILIHYSCESFYDRTDGSSPHITSLAVRNLGSAQTTAFSIHQIAERSKVALRRSLWISLRNNDVSQWRFNRERHLAVGKGS
jgi:hypothetical protein